MRIISDKSLCCFLEDLRGSLDFYKKNASHHVVHLNIDGFYWYFGMINPVLCAGTQELMETVEPFIPVIVSEENLDLLVFAYENEELARLEELEADFLRHSKLKFINSILAVNSYEEWDRIRNICRTIRSYKSRLHSPQFV